MNIWLILFLFFSFQSLTLSVTFFFKKKGNKTANRLLSIYFGLFSYEIFYNVLYWSQDLYSINFISLVHTNYIPWFLYGPIFHLYSSKVLFGRRIKRYDTIHLIPLLIMVLNYSPFFLASISRKIQILNNQLWPEMMYYYTKHEWALITGILVFYFILTFYSFKNKITSLNRSKWFKLFVLCYVGYVISFGSYFILRNLGFEHISYDYIISFSMIIFIGGSAYFSTIQPDVFDGKRIENLVPFIKYKKSSLTKKHSNEIKIQLLNLMQTEKLFLNDDLRLEKLAEKLNVSLHNTSQTINEQFDLSFFDFINQYRVKHAKDMLLEQPNLSVTEILYASGFNNRDSFYKAFRKFAHMTPTEFRNLNNMAS